MKRFSKLLALTLCLVMVAAAFAGCTQAAAPSAAPANPEPATQTQAPAAQAEPEPAAETGTIRLGIWPEDNKVDEITMHEAYVEIFNELHPGIEIVPAYYKYATDTFVALAESHNIPTVFETWYTEPQKLIKNDLIADITDELTQKGWAEDMNPDIRNLMSDENGRIYGIPRDGYALGLMLNVELFEQAGLVDASGYPLYPRTWQELAETAKKIKDATGSAGLCLLAKDNAGGWHFSNIAWAFGAVMQTEENGLWYSHLDSPEMIAAMQYIYDLRWVYDVLTPDPGMEDWGTGFAKLGTGAAAMYIAANDAVNQPTYVSGLAVDKLSLVPLPAGPGGQYSLMGGTPYVFSKDATSEEISAALDYIEIMGKAPTDSEYSLGGLEADARYRKENGIPVIPRFPAWTSAAYKAAEDAANAKYLNVDMALYQDYYDAVATEGNLRLEEPKNTQEMYGELTKVLQAVVTDKNADIPALLGVAQANFQLILDHTVNNG